MRRIPGPGRDGEERHPGEKAEFMEYCFREACKATETWIARLQSASDLTFEDPAYRAMWAKLNAEAGLTGMPDETNEIDGSQPYPITDSALR